MSLSYVSKKVDREALEPFSVTKSGEIYTVYTPKNIDELIKTNYLVRAVLKIAIERGYLVEQVDKTCNMNELKENQVNFLRGWGLSVQKVPEYAKNLNKDFKKGVETGIYYMLDNNGIDRGLFKTADINDINLHLFGNTWKTTFAVEKKLIDLLKNLSRNSRIQGEVFSWTLSLIKVMERYGLKDPTSNKLLSNSERNFLKTKYNTELDFKVDSVENVHSRRGDDTDFIGTIKEFQENLKTIQKHLKFVKEIVDHEINQRGNFVFKNKLNKKGKKSKTFEEMVNNVKADAGYANAFNSTLLWTNGKVKLTISVEQMEDRKFVEQTIKMFVQNNALSQSQESELNLLYGAYFALTD